MSRYWQISIIVALAAFLSGFFYGQAAGKKQVLQKAVAAFNARRDINHAVDKADAVELCLALGGVRAACRSALRGVGAAAETE